MCEGAARDVYVVGSSGGACAGSFLFLQDSDACDKARSLRVASCRQQMSDVDLPLH